MRRCWQRRGSSPIREKNDDGEPIFVRTTSLSDRNPEWDETLELEVPYDFVNGEMRVEVMDCDEIDDDE